MANTVLTDRSCNHPRVRSLIGIRIARLDLSRLLGAYRSLAVAQISLLAELTCRLSNKDSLRRIHICCIHHGFTMNRLENSRLALLRLFGADRSLAVAHISLAVTRLCADRSLAVTHISLLAELTCRLSTESIFF
ncbi:hypothetical protein F2Q69_00021190 [Brassica cretica]|uniref:Uncharacterized protein n=1 Tax=Brassica cretica TaxID=69181 RepID=A0A8S9PZH5_BRACR|nr:hypothetical protein F2Q69_00021190 [Brassica cretica]